MSLPSWECGLKYQQWLLRCSLLFVTPFVGVWIEICIHSTQLTPKECHSLRGSVDWNSFGEQFYSNKVGHSLRGSVDWNFYRSMMGYKLTPSLPSWECGLKYNSNKQRDRRSEVTPFVGVWIEILNWRNIQRCKLVTPFVGVWIEICEPSHACELNLVTPFVGVWIEIPFIY